MVPPKGSGHVVLGEAGLLSKATQWAVRFRFTLSRHITIFGSTDTFGSTGAMVEGEERLWMPDYERYFDDVVEKAVDCWQGRLP